MIVKLQRPLFSTVKNPPALAYDQTRAVHCELPMTEALRKLFRNRAKIYCEAEVDAKGRLVIGKPVPDRRDW